MFNILVLNITHNYHQRKTNNKIWRLYSATILSSYRHFSGNSSHGFSWSLRFIYFYLFILKKLLLAYPSIWKVGQRMIFISSKLLTETWSPKTKQTKPKDIYKILWISKSVMFPRCLQFCGLNKGAILRPQLRSCYTQPVYWYWERSIS